MTQKADTLKVQVGAAADGELRTLLKTVTGYLSHLADRLTGPDLANGFANNGCGPARIGLDQLSAYRTCERPSG